MDELYPVVSASETAARSAPIGIRGFALSSAAGCVGKKLQRRSQTICGGNAMTELTRRTLLTGAAAAAAAAPLSAGAPARAAAPLAGAQAPGWYRYKVGDFEIMVVTDGMARFKLPDNMVSNAKREEVNAALAAAHLQPDLFVTPYNPILVNTGPRLVLIDTGNSEAAFKSNKGATGQLLTNLAATGIDAKAIDTVIISHYHGDHVNGLLKADNSLAFPNAEILVPAAEHAFWMDDGEMSRAPKGRMEGLFKNNRRVFSGEVMKRLRTYAEGKEVVPGITAVGTHGHSAGHNSHVVSSGSATVFVQADVTHVPFLFARNPGWHALFDQDPAMAEATRRQIYDMLVAEKMMVQGFHYPFPSVAYVERSATGYREVAVPWNPSI
jgi:glyoxylase-like metal-dependent hydrolase (beta-lactamase superfamily II)